MTSWSLGELILKFRLSKVINWPKMSKEGTICLIRKIRRSGSSWKSYSAFRLSKIAREGLKNRSRIASAVVIWMWSSDRQLGVGMQIKALSSNMTSLLLSRLWTGTKLGNTSANLGKKIHIICTMMRLTVLISNKECLSVDLTKRCWGASSLLAIHWPMALELSRQAQRRQTSTLMLHSIKMTKRTQKGF